MNKLIIIINTCKIYENTSETITFFTMDNNNAMIQRYKYADYVVHQPYSMYYNQLKDIILNKSMTDVILNLNHPYALLAETCHLILQAKSFDNITILLNTIPEVE